MSLPVLTPPPAKTTLPERVHALVRAGVQKLPAPIQHLKLSAAHAIWAGLAAIMAVFFVWMLWPRAEGVELAVIDRGLVQREIVDEGRTRMHDVYVIAAPVAGALQRIELEPGDAVAAGQVVARLAPAQPGLLDARVSSQARAEVAASAAALAAVEAELDLARAERQRVMRLFERGFASQAARDAAQAAFNAATATRAARQADLARARALAGLAETNASASVAVRAPAGGRLLRLFAESEAVVGAGAPLMEVGDPDQLEIVAEFLSQDAVGMRIGARAFIEDWGGAPIAARVARIEPYAHTKVSALGVEEQRVNVVLRLVPSETPPALGHGYRVDVRVIAAEETDALRAPTDALVRDGEGWAVYRIAAGRARLTPVELGEGGARYRAVTRGLSEGDRIILFPSEALRDGARVRALD